MELDLDADGEGVVDEADEGHGLEDEDAADGEGDVGEVRDAAQHGGTQEEARQDLGDVARGAERRQQQRHGAGGGGDEDDLEEEQREGEVQRVVPSPDAGHGDLRRVEAEEVRPARRRRVIPQLRHRVGHPRRRHPRLARRAPVDRLSARSSPRAGDDG